ncbi:MAG TPA: hypothetical protein VJM06_08850 [Gaiellaceae bacterium]|jgi:hypothetical protein|nr:hypothetical protein [Gaiellaceae bacterium]
MSVVETHIQETEDERVARWRLEQLTRAGYEETAALVLADLVDIDLHLAVDLVRQGCPSDTALRILL